MTKTKAEVKKGIMQLLVRATPENRRAVINLFPAAKNALDSGYLPDLPARSVLHSWRCLLTLLANVASMQTDADIFLRVSNALLAITDRLVPTAEALRKSAEILSRTFNADLFVCRMRDNDGSWFVTAANSQGGKVVPLLARSIDENLLQHPVMRTIARGHEFYVVSNNLKDLEEGGGSYNAITYKVGYRSRLCFLVRDRTTNQAFGLIMLYSLQNQGFDVFEDRFLSRCGRLINLVVGRHVALARDTLEKAAGAMAHYGNNALNTMRVQTEYCSELVECLDESRTRALTLARQLIAEHAGNTRARLMALELESLLERTDMTELAGHLGGVLDGTRRMAVIIKSLKKSAERPKLLRYVRGVDVLKLEDGRNSDE